MSARTEQGGTVLGMLVAVVIVAILASIAMPVWSEAVIRMRRSEAQATLQELMQQQERHFTRFNSYVAFSASAPAVSSEYRWWSGRAAKSSAYEVEGKACDGGAISDCIQLIATPGTSNVDPSFRDPQCERLILTSTGLHLASGPRADLLALTLRGLRRLAAALRRCAPPWYGFTLLELLIVLAILSILFASALPELGNMLAARQLRTASADLLAAINDTRAQAIARRQVVTLLTENGNWQQGWLIVLDANGNRTLDPGETVLARRKPPSGRLKVKAKFTDPTAPFYVAYNAAGRSCRAAHPNAANFGTITLELAGAQRNIKINMQGRARQCDPALEPATCTSI